MKGKIGAIILGILMFFGIIFVVVSLERIPTGYEGVVYNMNGGVNGETLNQGFHFVSPTKSVKKFTGGTSSFS